MKLVHCDIYKEEWKAQKIRGRLDADKPYKCADCGKIIWKLGDIDDRVELHHIIPLVRGGITEGNLAFLCHHCHITRHRDLEKRPELPLFEVRKCKLTI